MIPLTLTASSSSSSSCSGKSEFKAEEEEEVEVEFDGVFVDEVDVVLFVVVESCLECWETLGMESISAFSLACCLRRYSSLISACSNECLSFTAEESGGRVILGNDV